MAESIKHVATLGNSIIGVSVLAMPFCFKQCGIFLGIVMLMTSALLTRFNCHLLLKAALITRRKTYELVAHHSLGFYGKLAVEASIIGFLMGILISFYVVIGDLGPPIIKKNLEMESFPELRSIFLIALGLGVALPLGLLRNISSLGGISTLSISFYVILVIKVFVDALPNLLSGAWFHKVNFWQPRGILQCLPIFSLALSCQTQIFEISDALPDPSLGKMNKMIKVAVYFCTSIYILVGFFGYVAFFNEEFSGNALVMMPPSSMTQLIKLGFVVSVVLSFPLVIFPCRASLYSLFNNKKIQHTALDVGTAYIPEQSFRTITVTVVVITLVLGILCPNIELVLGLVGSTIGTVICIIFPAVMFIRVTNRNTFERTGAQVVLCAGVFLLVACSIATIQDSNDGTQTTKVTPVDVGMLKLYEKTEKSFVPKVPDAVASMRYVPKNDLGNTLAVAESENVNVKETAVQTPKSVDNNLIDPQIEKETIQDKVQKAEESQQQRRQEPPVPQEPEINNKLDFKEVTAEKLPPAETKVEAKQEDSINHNDAAKDEAVPPAEDVQRKNVMPGDSVPLKEDNVASKDVAKELVVAKDIVTPKDAVSPKGVAADGVAAEQKEILKQLAEQQEVQKNLIQQQRQVLEELKAHKEAHNKLLSETASSKLGTVAKNNVKQAGTDDHPVKTLDIGLKKQIDPLIVKSVKPVVENVENVQSRIIDYPPVIATDEKKNTEAVTIRVLNLGDGSHPKITEQKVLQLNEKIADNVSLKNDADLLVKKSVSTSPKSAKNIDESVLQAKLPVNSPLKPELNKIEVSKDNGGERKQMSISLTQVTEKPRAEIRKREILMQDFIEPGQHLGLAGKVSHPSLQQK